MTDEIEVLEVLVRIRRTPEEKKMGTAHESRAKVREYYEKLWATGVVATIDRATKETLTFRVSRREK
jgi:hypothetical protein